MMNRRLVAALSALLPTAEQTLLLRASLANGDGAAAWSRLQRRLDAGQFLLPGRIGSQPRSGSAAVPL